MNEGWSDILEPGEKLLWQAQPETRISVDMSHLPQIVFGIIFAGFAVFWMAMAAKAGSLWMFGLVHFAAGISVAIGPILIGPAIRARTWYSLTDRRAFFARAVPFGGRTLNALRLTSRTGIDFDGAEPGTIKFRGVAAPLVGTRPISNPTFISITDARRVFTQIRDIQRGIA